MKRGVVVNGLGALLLLAAAVTFHLANREPEVSQVKLAPTMPTPERNPFTASAPEPAVEKPKPYETVQAMEPSLAARPEVQAQKAAIARKASSGVPAVMQAWREKPLDQEVVVETVMALRQIGTPEAQTALESMTRESPTASGVVALLGKKTTEAR